MATLTRLATTLTAKYFPSQTLTDAFYIDGRLSGKREIRHADITIEKEERGFFMSLYAHPKIAGYEPGMMPPYEPSLRATCNEVKFSRKEIDAMIQGFLSTSVDVTGQMKLQDKEDRSAYFSGIIIRDAEAFAVTIGSGLAFLYRDDTLFPLTDAGIPMEPINASGDRVGDFLYYCSSKTANALWSNFFTLSPDDCIILCNKEVYEALGQRELLRLLSEAEDQCDAAGVIITQASARKPNVPMQFAISFVDAVESDEKKGLFGFRKKAKEEDASEMSIKSTLEGGIVGAALEAASSQGIDTGVGIEDKVEDGGSIFFGDNRPDSVPPTTNQEATGDQGFVVDSSKSSASVEFLDKSVDATPVELSPEDTFKTILEGSAKAAAIEEAAKAKLASEVAEQAASPFVSSFNPFDVSESTKMEEVKTTAFTIPEETDNEKTKPVTKLDLSSFEASTPTATSIVDEALKSMSDSITKANEEPVIQEVEEKNGEFVFAPGEETVVPVSEDKVDPNAEFNPYSVGSSEEIMNGPSILFGDSVATPAPDASPSEPAEETSIPAPDFSIDDASKEITEDDKLDVDFPVTNGTSIPEAKEETNSSEFILPFENDVETIEDVKPAPEAPADVPEMPLYNGNTYDTPVNAVSSEEPITMQTPDVYSLGQYQTDESMNASYEPYGNEGATFDSSYEVDPSAQHYEAYQEADYAPADEYYQPNDNQGESASSDDEWINSILGYDEFDTGYSANSSATGGQDMYGNPDLNTNNVASYEDTRPKSAPTQRRPSPQSGGGSNGGGNKPKKKYKLNRNGWVFLGFVAICLICLIVLICSVVKACSKSDEKDKDKANEPDTSVVETTPVETTPAETTAPDPSAPMGRYYFSDFIGYRTWWDLFKNVYGIELENESDERIATLITYNGLDPLTYRPSSGDQLLLPPLGVIDGTIPNTFTPGASTPDQTKPEDGVSGAPSVTEGGGESSATPENSESSAEGT